MGFQLTLDLKSVRLWFKAKDSASIPKASCVRKEIVDINIYITFWNGDRKIMQTITIMS